MTDGRKVSTGGPSERRTNPSPTRRWHPVGASTTCPGTSSSPSRASCTSRCASVASQLASPSVKPSAMCWTIAIGTGKAAGSARSSVASARGPPSDAPMATSSGRTATRGTEATRSRRPRTWRITFTPASRRSLDRRSRPYSSRSVVACGFSRMSSAPSERARNPTASSRFAVSTRIGVGVSAMIRAMPEKPSASGMLRSIVTTSGLSDRASVAAAFPSAATATTSNPGSTEITRASRSRNSSESSATSTRMGRSSPSVTRPPR